MKKVNIVLGTLSIFFLLVHGITSGLHLAGILPDSEVYRSLGSLLVMTVMAHMVLSLTLQAKNANKAKNIKVYMRLNAQTMIQNITGIMTIISIVLHTVFVELSLAGIIPPGSVYEVIGLISEMLLATLVCLHLSISLPRMFVSWGLILKESSYKNVQLVMRVLVSVLWVFLMVVQFKQI